MPPEVTPEETQEDSESTPQNETVVGGDEATVEEDVDVDEESGDGADEDLTEDLEVEGSENEAPEATASDAEMMEEEDGPGEEAEAGEKPAPDEEASGEEGEAEEEAASDEAELAEEEGEPDAEAGGGEDVAEGVASDEEASGEGDEAEEEAASDEAELAEEEGEPDVEAGGGEDVAEGVASDEEPSGEEDEDEEEEAPEEELFVPKDDGIKRRWYAIHAYSGQEASVKRNLMVHAEQKQLGDLIGGVLIPMEEVAEIKSGAKKISKRKFFPGYVLVHLPEHPERNPELWHLIKNTPGVSGFIGSRTVPVPLENGEVEAILAEVRGERERPKPKVRFEHGERVKIIDGPFSNFLGNIDEVNADRGTLKVMVEIFERLTSVEVEFWQVEKI